MPVLKKLPEIKRGIPLSSLAEMYPFENLLGGNSNTPLK